MLSALYSPDDHLHSRKFNINAKHQYSLSEQPMSEENQHAFQQESSLFFKLIEKTTQFSHWTTVTDNALLPPSIQFKWHDIQIA